MYGGIILHGYIRRYLRQQPYDDDNGNFRSSSVIYSVPFPVGTAKFSFCFYGYNYIIIRYILCTDNEVVADARTHAGICGMCGCLPQSVVRVALKMFAKKKKKGNSGPSAFAEIRVGRARSPAFAPRGSPPATHVRVYPAFHPYPPPQPHRNTLQVESIAPSGRRGGG